MERGIMVQVLHRSATTTETIRRAIQHSEESLRALARRHGINAKTVANWFMTLSICKIYREGREGYFLILVSLVLGISFLVLPTYAQSAAKWSKIGLAAEAREDYDAAFEAYRHAHQEKVGDLRYKTSFDRVRFHTATSHVDRGHVLRQSGDLSNALAEFHRALEIDGGNQAAIQEIDTTQKMISNSPARFRSCES
jgi:tetratricopeptide (TPR) repeat protein